METKSFDASRYLTTVNGRDYLEVKWRLLWLRSEHPEAMVSTDLVKLEEGLAVFKARVALPGGGEATGWGSERAGDFEDYLEAAETKALGRALAALGYGTQFCQDFESSPGAPLVVDAPVELPQAARRERAKNAPPKGATSAQIKAIYAIARDQEGWENEEVDRRSRELFHHPPAELTREEASDFIDRLKGRRVRSTP